MNPATVLRKALDQFVENQREYVETGVDVTDTDREELTIGEAMLDRLNEQFLADMKTVT